MLLHLFFLWCFEITALLCSSWTFYEVFQLRVTGQRVSVLINEVMEKDGHSLVCYPPTHVAPCGVMTQNILV